MAWTCTGRTNTELVSNMARERLLSNERVIAALSATDRANYVRDTRDAYVDSPQSIGHGATISAPHMHAHALEALEPFLKPGAHALDVGAGSGVLCGALARLVAPGGRVVGVDHVSELVQQAKNNLARDNAPGGVEIVCADGRLGWPPSAPYDVIHVGAAAPELADALVAQLKAPGRMFIPVGVDTQDILQVDKDADGNVTKKTLFGVMYIPLTDLDKQLKSGQYS